MTASPTESLTWVFVGGEGVTVLWVVIGDLHWDMREGIVDWAVMGLAAWGMFGAAVGAVIGDWLGPVVGNALRAEMRDRLGAVASMVIEVGMLRQHRYVAWGQAQQARKTSFSFALQTRIRSLRNVQFASTCALQTRYAGCKEKKKEKEKVRLLASAQRDAKYHTGLPRQANCKQ